MPLLHQYYLTIFFANFLFLASLSAQSAICSGNYGDNIFEAGDFGSGLANNLATNPNIAPGYNYTTSVPPSDGSYIITNNTGAWSGLYSTWLSLRDNSNDPNGYMMVVNASYGTGLFYEQIIEGLCENTLYVFSADIINVVKKGVTDHRAPNVSFLIDDEVIYSTGNIAATEQWNTYGFTFTSKPGTTSLKLSLRNNAPGGIGNDLALDNITFRACGPEALILPKTIANICEDGDPIVLNATVNGDQYTTPNFQWQQSFDEGQTWENIPNATSSNYQHIETRAGFYYYRYLLANASENLDNGKCRVNSNVKIVHVVPKFYEVTDTLCAGLSYEQSGKLYEVTGIYTDSLLSSLGCDSIVTLNLTIVPDLTIMSTINSTPPSCFGYQDASISVTNVQNAYLPTTIFLQERQVVNTSARFDQLSSGDYAIYIEDRHGCTFSHQLSIKDPDLFEIEAGETIIVELGTSLPLTIDGNYPIVSTTWSIPDCMADCEQTDFYPTQSATYQVTATSSAGCVATDELGVTVETTRKVYIPNAFSPNGDGENDYFSVYAKSPNVKAVLGFNIFDRWGNLIVKREAIGVEELLKIWDGRVQGKEVASGVYVYQMVLQFLDDEVIKYSGDILVK